LIALADCFGAGRLFVFVFSFSGKYMKGIFSRGQMPKIGARRKVGHNSPEKRHQPSNMVLWTLLESPGSRKLAAPSFYAPNVSSGRHNFPANTFRMSDFTVLQYGTSVLLLGATGWTLAVMRLSLWRLMVGTIPYPVYDQFAIEQAKIGPIADAQQGTGRGKKRDQSTLTPTERLSLIDSRHVIGQAPLGCNIRISGWNVRNIVVVCSLCDVGLDLMKIYAAYPDQCYYQPDDFPGLKLSVPITESFQSDDCVKTVPISIFTSGKGLLIGKMDIPEVDEVIRKAKIVVAPHRDLSISATPGGRNKKRIEGFYAQPVSSEAHLVPVHSESAAIEQRIRRLNERTEQELMSTLFGL